MRGRQSFRSGESASPAVPGHLSRPLLVSTASRSAPRSCPRRCACRVPQVVKEPRTRTHGRTPMQTGTMRLRELTIKYSLKKSSEGEPVVVGCVATRPSEVAPALMTILNDEPAEEFAILGLT